MVCKQRLVFLEIKSSAAIKEEQSRLVNTIFLNCEYCIPIQCMRRINLTVRFERHSYAVLYILWSLVNARYLDSKENMIEIR